MEGTNEHQEIEDTNSLQLLLDSLLEAPELDKYSAREIYVNSCEECAIKQQEELDVLAAVYGDDFTLLPSQEGGDKMLDIKIKNLFVEHSYSFVFSVNMPPTYPNTPPLFDLHSIEGFKRNQIDQLWQSIIAIGEGKIGEPMLYDMTSYCQEYMANLQTQPDSALAATAEAPQASQTSQDVEFNIEGHGEQWEEKRVFGISEIRSYFRNMDLFGALRKVEETKHRVVRVEIITNVHRESVFSQKCEKSRKANHQKPVWVWHGTDMSNIPSIVARGLLPAGATGVRMVNGNAYGNGIYLGKEPNISLGYARDSSNRGITRLLLCALLLDMNNVKEYPWGYVCTNGALILPSYAVDIIYDSAVSAYNPQAPERATPLHSEMEQNFEDLKGKEKLEKMTAYASRHLPFGFGSAVGDSFCVLEVAPHDDDDDDTLYSEVLYAEQNTEQYSSSEYSREIQMTQNDWDNEHKPKAPNITPKATNNKPKKGKNKKKKP